MAVLGCRGNSQQIPEEELGVQNIITLGDCPSSFGPRKVP
jgi:hypothetical protein